jgi:AraC-like DNA-binding protein
MVYLSESKLTKGFKALFGRPVHTYVIDKRLETALLLLEKGGWNVSDVAGVVGYGNISHFAAAFKKKYGVNPGEFVKSLAE